MLLQEVIKYTFGKKTTPTHFSADSHLRPEKIIVLEPAEAFKFSYVVGWIVYKLTKNDNITKSHVIPGQEFLEFMYKMKSLILLLFEKYEEFEFNIL